MTELRKEEVKVLIERFAEKEIELHMNSIYIYIIDKRYVNMLKDLSLKSIEEISKEIMQDFAYSSKDYYLKDQILNLHFSFEDYKFNSKINLAKPYYLDKKYNLYYDDMYFRNFIIEEREEKEMRHYEELLEQENKYDNERNLADNTVKDNEPVDIDELNNDLDEALK